MQITFETSVKSWRIADGLLIRGRGRGGEEQTSMIAGRLERVGIYEGTTDDNELYKKLEVDLNVDGQTVSVGCNIKLDPKASNVTAFQFAQGLLAVEKGDYIAIKPDKSKEPHEKYGTYTTFVNIGLVDPETLKAKAVKVDKNEFPGESSKEKLPSALERLQKHSAFADRPKRDEDEDAGGADEPEGKQHEFIKLTAEKGWPSVLDVKITPTYLKMCAAVAGDGADFKSLADVPDAVWDEMIQSAKQAKKLPKLLDDAVKAADDYDPFAE